MTTVSLRKQKGFTIVELLIVIVVIAILATISIVMYRGIQERGRDSQRESDVAVITKALEMYYIDNGRYPAGSGSTVINSGWSTTADASWANLATHLVPKYISSLPGDPVSRPGVSPLSVGNYNYAYFGNHGGQYCAGIGQAYVLVYNFESKAKKDTFIGECDTVNYSNLGSYTSSVYRVVK